MITYTTLNNQLSNFIQKGYNLSDLKESWENEVKTLNRFFDMFIERFGEALEAEEIGPEHKLYMQKTEEYNNYVRAIRNVEYWISKETISKR
jgi:hypothetical protein